MKIPRDASAVVTGAGSGFGHAVSRALARRGARVLVTDVNAESAEETAAGIRADGHAARSMKVDVRDPDQVRAAIDSAVQEWSTLDVIVNNAGVAVAGDVGDVPLEDWRHEIDINLWGVIYGCHFAVPIMKRQRSGFILNVASAAGIVASPRMGPYNVTKAGVIALSETLRGELADAGVAVTVLCPTFFRTNIHEAQRSPEELKKMSERLVTGAKWSADQIAEIALAGLERGELYVIPQTDGKIAWRAKRLMGQSFYTRLMPRALERMLKKG